MKLIKASPGVVFRNYEGMTVLYNVVYKNYAVINDIGSVIWNYISAEHDGVNFSAVVNYIALEYRVDRDVIFKDVDSFVNHLFAQNMVSVDGKFDVFSAPSLLLPSENDVEGEIIQFLQGKHQIYSATFELTYACNEKCVHCYATAPVHAQNEAYIDLAKCKQLIDELYQMKCMHLAFTGGDPFMFNGFVELLEYARSKRFSFDIYTNGQALANNPHLIDKIRNLYPRTFYISLYGATAKTHDAITQIKGSFEKTVLAIKLLKKAGISVVLNVMLMKPNCSEAQMIIDLADQMGVEYRIGISLIRKNDGNDTPMEYFIDDEATIEEILKCASKNVVSMDSGVSFGQSDLLCGAGTTSLCISPNGDVYPCVSLKKKLGSVFSESLSDIWNDSTKKEYVYSLTWKNTKRCMICEYHSVCPHCIGISEAECGDVFECNYCDQTVARCLYHITNGAK